MAKWASVHCTVADAGCHATRLKLRALTNAFERLWLGLANRWYQCRARDTGVRTKDWKCEGVDVAVERKRGIADVIEIFDPGEKSKVQVRALPYSN